MGSCHVHVWVRTQLSISFPKRYALGKFGLNMSILLESLFDSSALLKTVKTFKIAQQEQGTRTNDEKSMFHPMQQSTRVLDSSLKPTNGNIIGRQPLQLCPASVSIGISSDPC